MPVPSHHKSLRRLALIAPVVAAAALSAPSAASAAAKVGSVYTQSNDLLANQVIVFNRLSDGTLTEAQRVATGGLGGGSLAPGCAGPGGAGGPPACVITDSQGSVGVTAAGGLVFVTNAGSNTISSFDVSPTRGLTLVSQVPSGGDFPQSLDIHGNVLYVLNEHSGNIDGFKFSSDGKLTEIPGSSQPLATPGPGGVAAQVGFNRTGSSLTVTERGTNLIDTFPVHNGVAGPVSSTPSTEPTPFGFAYDAFSQLVVTDAGMPPATGFTSTFAQSPSGALTPIDAGVSTGGVAPCWIVITPNQRFAYVSNTVTKDVAEYSLTPTGHLTRLGNVPIVGAGIGMDHFPTDVALSRDGRFLYVIVPDVFTATADSFIEAFRVGPSGQLTYLSQTSHNLPVGISGLAAR